MTEQEAEKVEAMFELREQATALQRRVTELESELEQRGHTTGEVIDALCEVAQVSASHVGRVFGHGGVPGSSVAALLKAKLERRATRMAPYNLKGER